MVFGTVAYSNDGADSAFQVLSQAIKNKSLYTRQKEERIASLKKLKAGDLSLSEQYAVNDSLYQEYKKFKIDSAVFYADQNLQVARKLQRPELVIAAQLQLSNSYSSLGKFLESEQILKSLSSKALPKPILMDYYDAYIQFYEHYATNSYNKNYVKLIQAYRDSLIIQLNPASVRYQINLIQKQIYQRDLKTAQAGLLRLLASAQKQSADYAMITYLLAFSNQLQHHTDIARKYYTLSAITDVRNAIKDNASLQNLALIFYETGDLDNAYIFTKSAIEDAIFCNVKFRTLRMSELYTIINTAYLEKEGRQKSQLKLYLVLISVLTVFLIIAVIYVYKQMKRVSRIKEELHASGKQLAALNQEISHSNVQLSDINAQLSEANQVKEAYIAQFFDLCSTYINKLEDYRKTLNKKANEKHVDELFKMLRSTTVVDTEVEGLYKVFDNIFLSLYPNFIREFNALLLPEEQVTVKPGELLNTELRIFALIRLGITDSVKIAAFLRYSLSTIYNYRTRARNKAAVSRDDFEKRVMKIGILPV
ncbi:hypothetical protein KHS38_16260 [Mucilaginibacter sp. Bleaf8]|uniref:DUF6377 domain-containing protein n=1 Tax=Mucilaginibacter sp. Bleaf8 TaxID=2834430 RepID=UPI001BD036CD|nr:DUF6377 domain-containing protein [Mucilaginibacter sp. Bleaf8]MBS7565963.1 hypothetical protein [Mucilaginibacter sp. Bleaf8]